MKVYLSWSGRQSRLLAEALRDWLPSVLQAVQPWLSSTDVGVGQSWHVEVANVLQHADVGIICLTQSNLRAPWLHFEAGALSKRADKSLLLGYALDVNRRNVSPHLAQFWIAKADKDDTFRLVQSINSVLREEALDVKNLNEIFNLWWPRLKARLENIKRQSDIGGKRLPAYKVGSKGVDEKLDELLELVRGIGNKADLLASQSETVSPPIGPKPTDWREEGRKPRVFIGSSTEGLSVAEELQVCLDYVAECVIWNQAMFKLSETVIEGIVDAAVNFDFAIIILTPDDALNKRDIVAPSPRDNLIFELGLFTGVLGRARTFMVHPRDTVLHLPSDLAGVNLADYAIRADGNLAAALGPVCTRIKRAMGVAGPA